MKTIILLITIFSFISVNGVELAKIENNCLSSSDESMNDQKLLEIVMNNPQLTSIRLRGGDYTDETLFQIAAHYPDLLEIAVPAKNITDAGVAVLVSGCTKLRSIYFGLSVGELYSGEVLSSGTLTDSSLFSIGAHCSNLKKIYLVSQDSITDEGIIALAKGCPKLTYLDVATKIGQGQLSDESLFALSKRCDELHLLNVSGHLGVTTKGVVELVKKCKKLVNLSVENTSFDKKKARKVWKQGNQLTLEFGDIEHGIYYIDQDGDLG